MPQNSSKSETSENYLERNPICANRKWLLTCAGVVFEINQIPSKDICVQVYFPQVTKNSQTNCQCVSSQSIASKTQETHSRGNTGLIHVSWGNSSVPQIRVGNRKYFFLFLKQKYVVCTQNNRLDDTVHLSTQNTCLNWWRHPQIHAKIA